MSSKISLYTITLFMLHSALNSDSMDSYYDEMLGLGNFKEDIDSGKTAKRCKNLGKSGWVVCPFWEMDLGKGETIIGTWEDKVTAGKGDEIAQYFIEEDYRLLKNICGRINLDLISLHENDYFNCTKWLDEANKVFFDKYYLSCAMLLTALLERLIRTQPKSKVITNKKRNPSELFNVTAKIEINEAKITSPYDPKLLKRNQEKVEVRCDVLSLMYEKYYFLPSLEGFIQTYYSLPGYNLEKGLEPDMLIRNWLMHGLTNFSVGEIECIKLFNAICTFLSMLGDLGTY